jgi:signal transduction histidine kinase
MSVFAGLAIAILCCTIGRFVRTACGVFCVLFPLVQLALWTLPAPDWEPTGGSWVFLLLNASGAAAVIAFPLPWQVAWVVLAPGIYTMMRLTRRGFTPEIWLRVSYELSLALIIGATIVTIAWMLRSQAAGVDEARAAAVEEYTRAVAVDVAERERVEVAALMHDSVLAALIAAERASSERERQLAVAMAREALTRLANAESDAAEGSDEPLTVAAIGEEIAAQARALGAVLPVEVETDGGAEGTVPGRTGRALVLAATQAVANAIQHADAIGLRAGITARAQGRGEVRRIEIVVCDEGAGVDLDALPPDRLGIRASILARVAAVGGIATVESGPGGTTVRMVWPDAGGPAGEEAPGQGTEEATA